jgi:exopolysaccharide biosynthesis protein
MTKYTRAALAIGTVICVALFWATPNFAATSSEMDRIKTVRHSLSSSNLRIVVETEHASPQASVYYLTGPERLVIEVNDALPGTSLGAAPATHLVDSWGLKQSALNRSQLVLNLNHRPPTSELKVQVLSNPHRLAVDIPVDPYWKEEFPLTKGIKWIREDKYLAGLWVRLNRLQFDPKDPEITVMVGLAQEKTSAREKVSSMLKRTGALAGINGGFFASSGGALGLVYRDGKLLAPHVQRRPPRSSFGMTKDRKPLFGRLASTGPGIKDLDGGDWSQAWLALGGGPRLMKDGAPKITAKEEELGPGGNDITRVAGRSLVGSLNNGHLMFSTVTGFRDNHSQGAKFEPMVDWLKGLGVKDAVNYDGGASVNMVIGEHIVSDGPGCVTGEKPVATALLVKDDRPKLYPSSAAWLLSQTTMVADGKSTADALVSFKTPSGAPVPDGTPVRFFAHGVRLDPATAKTAAGQVKVRLGSVRRPGSAKVTAVCGPVSAPATLNLQGGETTRVVVKLLERKKTKVDKQDLLRVNAKVALTDSWGNPVANDEFTVEVDGSKPYPFRSDERGMSNLEVDTALTGGNIIVKHGKAGSVPLKIEPLP